jgi:hypothetical protein
MNDALFDPGKLLAALDQHRRSLRITWREVSRQCRVSAPTFSRMESMSPSAENLARLLLWLGNTDLRPYLTEEGNDA